MKRLMLCLLALCLAASSAHALDAASVPKPKQTKLGKYLSAPEAEHFVSEHGKTALFLDVRTPSEVVFLGMPTQADANVPYMIEPEFPTWDEAKKSLKLEPDRISSRKSAAASPRRVSMPTARWC